MTTADEMGLTPEAARGYEQFFVPAIFEQWPPIMLASASISDGDDVLDVGCGTGVFAREVTRRVGANGSVTGIDLSESMLGVAREMAAGVDFHQGSATNLPFEDASFDAVVSSFMLMFVPDPAQAIREMQRVLRPGGRLVVGVWQGLQDNLVYAALVAATDEVLGKEAAESMAWPFALGATGQLSAVFEAAGIQDIQTTAHDGTARFPSVEDFVSTEIRAWLLADSADDQHIRAIGLELRSRYPDFVASAGPIEFPLNAVLASCRKT
ncbi:MAG: methyltransferase domain-containing protein [Gammaproteobacteria bacterium]